MTKNKTDEKDSEKGSALMKQLLADEKNKIKIPQAGDLIEGAVIDIGKQTLFMDLGPIGTGVIYGRELQDGFGTLKSLKTGDKLKATVIDPENDEGYVELSIRTASYELAWEDIYKKMRDGEVVSIKIKEANRGGLVAELYGIKAFLPVSQLANEHYPRVEEGDKSQILTLLNKFINHEMRVKVIDANKEDEKLILSEKETYADEEKKAISLLKAGDVVEGVVSGVVDFGAFVKFNLPGEIPKNGGKELEGLVHISELAWQLIEKPRDIIRVGDKIQAKIIGIDGTRISLSLKALKEDPWHILKYKVGDIVDGKVHKITPYGAFVYLDKDIHGLIHISELGSIDEAKKVLAIGKTEKFKIISLEPKEHRMGLALASKIPKTAKPAAETPKTETAKHETKKEEAKPEAKKVEVKKTEMKKEAGKEKTEMKKSETKEKAGTKEKHSSDPLSPKASEGQGHSKTTKDKPKKETKAKKPARLDLPEAKRAAKKTAKKK
ncbi:MAG: S1 RNA-binding domain-containing protein [Patescibacteria group bacterium]